MIAEVERIRKINATKAWGHGDSAVSHCAFLLAKVTELEQENSELLKALVLVLDSAFPNRRDHPTMCVAWEFAGKLLARIKKP